MIKKQQKPKPVKAWAVMVSSNVDDNAPGDLLYGAYRTQREAIADFGNKADWEAARAAGYRIIRVEVRPL